jgi:hypothetical protein
LPSRQNTFISALQTGASYEGFLRLYPLPTAADDSKVVALGWTEMFLTPAGPGDMTFTAASTLAYRGIHRHSQVTSNDASNNPQSEPGNGFICPCPAASAAAAALAAYGIPLPEISAQSGELAEAEGVYVHDKIKCEWHWALLRRWNILTLTTSLPWPLLGAERLTATSSLALPNDFKESDKCFFTACNLGLGIQSTPQLLSLPAKVVFEANSSRMLPALRPSGKGGRFSINYQQHNGVPNGVRDYQSQSLVAASSRNPGQPVWDSAPSNISTSSNGAKARENFSEQRKVSNTVREFQWDDVNHNSVRTAATQARSLNTASGPLLLAMSNAQGQESPCTFVSRPESTLLR